MLKSLFLIVFTVYMCISIGKIVVDTVAVHKMKKAMKNYRKDN